MVSRFGPPGTLYDDERPDSIPFDRERATNPDIGAAKIVSAKVTRNRVDGITYPYMREQSVVAICRSADNLGPDQPKKMRSGVDQKQLGFAEYSNRDSGVTYLYLAPGYRLPNSVTSYRWVEAEAAQLKKPTLFRISPRGTFKILRVWED